MDKFTTDLQKTETYLIKRNLEFAIKQKFPFDNITVSFDDTLWIFTVVIRRIDGRMKDMEITREMAKHEMDVHEKLCFLEALPFE